MGFLVLTILILAAAAAAAEFPVARPGCADRCGNVSIPFPFGTTPDCYLDTDFFINCTQTGPLLRTSNIVISNISLTGGQLTVNRFIARDCYRPNGTRANRVFPWINIPRFAVSNAANKFVVVGCDTTGYVQGWRLDGGYYRTGCTATCSGVKAVENGSCTGLGCCMTSIPEIVRSVNITMATTDRYRYVRNFSVCGYAFVVEEAAFTFSLEKLLGLRGVQRLPMVVDWAIGDGNSCAAAKANASTYACRSLDSDCYEADNGFGYRCSCNPGFQGNPYLDGIGGCRDIDECKDARLHNCTELADCVNRNGTFDCVCQKGYDGDGRIDRKGCNPIHSKSESLLFRLVAGISLGVIVLLLSACWFFFVLQNKRLIKMRQHYFHQNGGMLLQQKLHGRERSQDLAKIYTEFELNKATKNFHTSMIIGEGGYGTVYKGFLPGSGIVAIKKAKQVPKQIDQFTNEVLVLSQIKHKNVVKLLGCCLETELPLLVYEFISNGTLSQHVHNKARARLLSWETRLRIATEIATVLSYLHSEAASTPIIHRDVKCANILLDHSFTAKVSDFGASRLVPLDPSQLSTMVQGTFGYLDPEYMQTSQLNEKSDVYSFGVVLVELLTGMTALSYDRPEEERNLANLFVMKKDHLFQIIEDNVMREGSEEEVMKVCVLARRCLNVRGEDRPSMKEVAMELEGLRVGGKKHSWIRTEYGEEDKESLLGKGFDGFINSDGKLGIAQVLDLIALRII